MESYLLDWANLLLRWLHVITAIAWIGSSFYFVFLDSSLTPPEDEDMKRDGVSGELWAVHGGGFYHPVKFNVSPPKMPDHLHWFYWESYTTWLSGFALLTVSYLWNAGIYLVSPSNPLMSSSMAIVAALGFLVVFWLLYDAICRAFGQKPNGDATVGAMVLVLVCIAAYLACHIFPGQAAFLLMGAMLATSMSANVFFWIIPGQRKVVAALKAGQPVDPMHGKRAKQRSVHNTYFTLPVLFAMLSNHYGWLYNHELNWLVLILMMFAGAAIRQFFVMRHGRAGAAGGAGLAQAGTGGRRCNGLWRGYPAGRLWPGAGGDAKALCGLPQREYRGAEEREVRHPRRGQGPCPADLPAGGAAAQDAVWQPGRAVGRGGGYLQALVRGRGNGYALNLRFE